MFGLPRWCSGKEPTCQCRRHRRCGFDTWVGKLPWRRKWQLNPLLLPGKFHRQMSLAGYSPWGPRELDMIAPYWAHTQLEKFKWIAPNFTWSHCNTVICTNVSTSLIHDPLHHCHCPWDPCLPLESKVSTQNSLSDVEWAALSDMVPFPSLSEGVSLSWRGTGLSAKAL